MTSFLVGPGIITLKSVIQTRRFENLCNKVLEMWHSRVRGMTVLVTKMAEIMFSRNNVICYWMHNFTAERNENGPP